MLKGLLFVLLLKSNCFAMELDPELGLEFDAASPIVNLLERSESSRYWISLRKYFSKYHIGLDAIHNTGLGVGGSGVGETGDWSAPETLFGLSVGYYFNGYKKDTFRGSLAIGHMERHFIDSKLGNHKTDGLYTMVEVGYQWFWSNGFYIFPSIVKLNTELKENHEFSSGDNASKINKPNTDSFKLSVGFIF